ncbi:1-(5-phosphoribosyl)-5-[(5-phosphoribosylamino)methylideneamino]imidazole-4-carboxamide isomerase [Gloeocapsopsis dulcis]|uniref:1-(5-phosphoribosyl)-5-[(5-phosphoribosylamino)methylideneamino] imidazole-4-carboxamide isomerase n=1 Tax=Gloeocapsopsis dulcis AAB1 = 1H9 TaxID=1433147 RepID=A0A6N8FQH5_9CHRO|nr:1-(5-phosphoribosyl)-5-[(5-phosphoribosylamino)methylideneamino]imidazole-4-carboxamide isomerase [Gloeocapsopsis dulcis]MUL34912.1 1-(5-phosphoribosyl)-5-[(5-phosphoribosylamino)methylideneamino]imidazole-4-carboxamide isomerase [Gloeocapsopsis dulcis AAB1 = 1H9]WNN90016.1 1-(5-phosphoribosyl)-5-[(5-phosphoribosylamino)methylideneamino]imidazole-4-carboxamide isomerase [Gloeocapsopsis dulcis]
MEVIPAIDLLAGKCVRLYQGDYTRSQVFNDNPADMAQQWVEQGATRLHVVDLDGAKQGKVVNLAAIEAITSAVSVPIQVGGGLRDACGKGKALRTTVAQLLDLGVQRVILGTVAVEQPQLVADLCQEFPGQIVVGIDARNGKVATRGWLETSEVLATQLATQMQELGAAAIIYTDIYRDGTLSGPNLEELRELATQISIPVIASGGVSSVTDLLSLLALEPLGVTGAIVGRALYTGDILLKSALQAVGQGRLQDIPPDLGSSTFA